MKFEGILEKWVSSYGFKLSVAGFMGAFTVIYALREGFFQNFALLNFNEIKNRDNDYEKWVVPGLRNLGNNCFLNVILQALSSCSCLQKFMETIVEECEHLLGEEWVDSLPLTAALASLMEDLRNIHPKRVVLDPRKLMNVMDRYISNFDLASQQDAEEALVHVLSSLRDEVSSISVPVSSSLAEVTSIENRRILSPKINSEQTAHGRWEKYFLGPFNGIIGSSLICESCSFQISLDYQLFHSLHISPVLSRGTNVIIPACSLADCLNQYFLAEQLENYCCSNCWHLAAVKYLSSMNGNETEIERLRHCCQQDACGCKHLSSLEAMQWSSRCSRTFKQLNISRRPKILCIHLQRVSVNTFGEQVKLQGHISIPLILKLSPFMKNYTGTQNSVGTSQTAKAGQNYRLHTNHFPSQFRMSMLDGVQGKYGQGFRGPNISHSGNFSDDVCDYSSAQFDTKAGKSCQLAAHSECDDEYQLVSVVEHFGRSGSGHYTVYRRALVNNDKGINFVRWFCISDSQVHVVSESDVLAAEASLLFYEKISGNTEIC